MKTLVCLLVLSACLSISAPALVQAQSAPSPDMMAVPAGNYTLESTHARVLFAVTHLGFSTWYGEFTRPTGTARFDPKNLAANTVDISIPVMNLSTSNAMLDKELKTADWFDAERFPTITFKSHTVTSTGPGTAEVLGDLTMHGVTRPVTLLVKFNMGGINMMTRAFTAGYDATARIHRMDFGISKLSPMIGDEVGIIISAPFEKTK